MWGKLLGLATRAVPIPLWAWKFVGIAALVAAGAGASWVVKHKFDEAEKVKQLQAVMSWATDQIKIDQKRFEDYQREKEQTATEYAGRERAARNVASPDCPRFGADWVRMRDDAIPDEYTAGSVTPGTAIRLHGQQ